MKKQLSKSTCDHCCNTGILNANLVKNEGMRRISVILCGSHQDISLAENSILSLQKSSGLEVDVSGAKKPE